jgi:CheY-like chemotaxis protein/anti-sigma regulatory factor (Ser/Thr protein kinase)
VQLESALLNVAINARDAMPDGGTLVLRCTADDNPDRVRIVVQDSGHGMPDDVRARAFEPFFTTKEAGRGTGLGLSTVYGFVTQSRGSIELASAPGAGTTVTMRLPVVAAAADGPGSAVTAVALPPGLRVLVVEDDPGVRDIARAFLGALACRTTVCSGASDAMAQLDGRAPFDLLFSDIALGPGPDGIAVARHAARRRPGLPVLLASGDPRPHAQAESAQWPLLRKPYGRAELAAAIHAALQGAAGPGGD